MRIEPTAGRVVLFTPPQGDALKKFNDQKLAAIVAHVNADGTINLAVFDAKGQAHARQNVLLVQPDDDATPSLAYAEWMPFQKGQAGKTDSLSPQVAEAMQIATEAMELARTSEAAIEEIQGRLAEKAAPSPSVLDQPSVMDKAA